MVAMKSGEQYAEFVLFDSYNRDPGQWGDNNDDQYRYGIAEIPLSPNSAAIGSPKHR